MSTPAFRTLLLALAICGSSRAAPAQQPDTALALPALTELPLRDLVDSTGSVTRFLDREPPTVELADSLVRKVFGPRRAMEGTYDWILYVPLDATPDTLVSKLYDPAERKFVDGKKLYEARLLRIVVILPSAGTNRNTYTVQAGTDVYREEGLLARGFPLFLGHLLTAAVRSFLRDQPGVPTYQVAVLSTPIGFPDATLLARVEIGVSPVLNKKRHDEVRGAFEDTRKEIEFDYLGSGDLRTVLDEMESTLALGCLGRGAGDCLKSVKDSTLKVVAGMKDLTAEHRISTVRKGAQQALVALETLLVNRPLGRAETFRVVTRPRIGFSVGGLLVENAGEKLEFEVEDGQVVAVGVEGDGFKSLVLLDLYFRRVDIGQDAAGFLPHASVGFTIGDVLQPGAFVATTLPGTAGRLSPFAGFILRRETEDASGEDGGDEGQAGEPEIDERRRFRFVAGLKVGLPIPP
jgi:hypothetical protein